MFDKLTRNILNKKPRAFRSKIDWMETNRPKFNDVHMTEAMASEVPSVGLHNQPTSKPIKVEDLSGALECLSLGGAESSSTPPSKSSPEWSPIGISSASKRSSPGNISVEGLYVNNPETKVDTVDVVVLDNPSPFSNPLKFKITFECIEDLKEDLEWKIIYVGSAESEAYDQVLDTVYVGPVPEGRHMFVFQADPPDPSKIPKEDAVGVTVLLLTCSYRNNEFIRIGYYVNNEYSDP